MRFRIDEEEEAAGSALLANQCDVDFFKPVARTAGLSGNIMISLLKENEFGEVVNRKEEQSGEED